MFSAKIKTNMKIFFIILTFNLLWWSVSPPFQVPDEYAHNDRLASLMSGDLLGNTNKAESKFVNGVSEVSTLVPRHSDYGFNERTIKELKQKKSLSADDNYVLKNCCASNYPPVFYSALALPNFILIALDLSPYDQYQILRISLVFLVSILWTFVAAIALKMRLRAIVIMAISTPMVGFMSVGINPDSVLFPLTVIYFLGLMDFLITDKPKAWHIGISFLLPLVKIFGFFLIMSGSLSVLICYLLFKDRIYKRIFRVLCVPGLFTGLLWYSMTGIGGTLKTAQQFPWSDIFGYYRDFEFLEVLKSVYGVLGWLDTNLPLAVYLLAGTLIIVSVSLAIENRNNGATLAGFRKSQHLTRDPFFLIGLIGLLYLASIILLDAYVSRYQGRILQGRYLLPAFFSLLLILDAYSALRKWIVVAWITLSIIAMSQCFSRYYADSFELALMSMPFSDVKDIVPSSSGAKEVKVLSGKLNRKNIVFSGSVDSIRKIGYNKYEVNGWYNGTEFQHNLSRFLIHSDNFEIISVRSELNRRIDLTRLSPMLENHGFRFVIKGFNITPDNLPSFCIFAEFQDGVEGLNHCQ